jgi:uncharacterized protein with HEPN domain
LNDQRTGSKLLWDARWAADRIARVVAGKNFADYLADDVLRWGVERQFTIVGEAFDALRRIEPGPGSSIPTWRASSLSETSSFMATRVLMTVWCGV